MPAEVEVGPGFEGSLGGAARTVAHVEVDVPQSGPASDQHHQNRQRRALLLHRCSRRLLLCMASLGRGQQKKTSKNAYSERPKHSVTNLASLPQKAHFSGALTKVT